MRRPDYVYMDTRATEEEESSMRSSYSTPLMVAGGWVPISPAEVMHAIALKHGLPEIVGHYGYDFSNHDFIRLPDATIGEPDEWPSRKLADILATLNPEPQS